MKKFKKLGVLFIFLFAVFIALCDLDTTQAASTGYVGHNWETPSTCGTCGGDHIISVSCTTCGGDGKVGKCIKCSAVKGTYATSSTSSTCSSCGSTTTSYSADCTACGADGVSSTKDCGNCYASGTYKGKNTKCTNSGCSKGTYAAWSDYPNGNCYAISYTVKYNGNGATSGSTANSTHTYDTAKALTANGFARTGYTFLGWSTSSTATAATYGNGASVKNLSATNGATVNLYAVWSPNTYTVTYNANGGTGAPGSQNFIYNVGFTVSTTEPTRTGYTFSKWKCAENSATLTPGQKVTGWGSCTLVAQWTANSYTVSLEANGGTCKNSKNEVIESVTTTYDSMNFCDLSYLTLRRPGYEFMGWYTALDGGTKVYGADGLCTNEGTYWKSNKWAYTDNVTLYARWERVPYTVTYDANGGTVEKDALVTYYNEPVDLSLKAEKNGLIFVGWNTDPDAKNGLQNLNMPESNLTLYAIYSIPVSDVKEVYLTAWIKDDANKTKTYLLAQTNKLHMIYTYELDITDIAKDFDSTDICYVVIAWDYAGNYRILKEGSVDSDKVEIPSGIIKKSYVQTVEHYLYDPIIQDYVLIDTVSEEKYADEIYIPMYLEEIPNGYQKGSIDAAYTVTGDRTSRAEYVPIEYTLSFDANGGSVTPSSKTIYYGDVYGELPTPERKGYTFKGWYTEKEGGTQIVSSMKYEVEGDSTIYAHWEQNKYKVTYDYWTNGGTYSSASSADTPYGTKVDLSVTAAKSGYAFVGWNMSPDATTALSSLVMEDKELVLYAIYKKDITATFIDSENGTKRTVTTTVYNNQTSGDITIPTQNGISGWTSLGWSLSMEADGPIDTVSGATYTLSENATFYGYYVKDVTISYDANGSTKDFGSWMKERYFNAGGIYKNPTFTIAAAPTLTDHSFVNWKVSSGTVTDEAGTMVSTCAPENVVLLQTNATLTATWDAHPEIEAYNRYFTLKQAQNGEITETALLEKVVGTDKEDGSLTNGSDVIVLNYNASTFTGITADQQVAITYQATDSFGNTVTKMVTITITDTTAKKSTTKKYVRFIGSQFFADNSGNLIPSAQGGLEETSIWRTNVDYLSLLQKTLSNVNTGGEEYETWILKKNDIQEIKDYTNQYGHVLNAVEVFLNLFEKLKD